MFLYALHDWLESVYLTFEEKCKLERVANAQQNRIQILNNVNK